MSEESINQNDTAQVKKVVKKTMLKPLKWLLGLITTVVIVGVLLVGSLFYIFRKVSGDGFKDNKSEWEEITKDFKVE